MFIPRYPLLEIDDYIVVSQDVELFVNHQLARAPFHYRIATTVLGVVFLGLYSTLSFFIKVSRQDGQALRVIEIISSLAQSLSSFARLYRSLTVLAFYDHGIVRRIMDS